MPGWKVAEVHETERNKEGEERSTTDYVFQVKN